MSWGRSRDEAVSTLPSSRLQGSFALLGRRVLIIGCSDGIGLATARRLVADGWRVVGISRSKGPLEAPAYHHEVIDVATPDYRSRLAEIISCLGPFEACVYCAGIGARHDLTNLDADVGVFQVNLMAAIETAAEFDPSHGECTPGQIRRSFESGRRGYLPEQSELRGLEGRAVFVL